MFSKSPATLNVLFLIAVLMNLRCTGGGNGSSPSPGGGNGTLSNPAQSFAGQLSLAQTSSFDRKIHSLDLTSYRVFCSTVSYPVQTSSSAVAADGSFSVNVAGFFNQPMTCAVINNENQKAADILVADPAVQNLNGLPSPDGVFTLTTGVSVGNITFNPLSKEAPVSVSAFNNTLAKPTNSNSFDPSGAWTVTPLDFTLPLGLRGACTLAIDQAFPCDGPYLSEQVFMKLWNGTKTADGSKVEALQFWGSQGQFTTCGSAVGMPAAVQTQLGVDFSSAGSANAPFAFSNSMPWVDANNNPITIPLQDNWKPANASLTIPLSEACGPHDVTVGGHVYKNAWVCGPDESSPIYHAQVAGGCTDPLTEPVNVTNWSGFTCGSASTDANGLRSDVCTGQMFLNGSTTTINCNNTWTVVDGSYNVQPASSQFQWSEITKLAAQTSCSQIATAASPDRSKVTQLQCYEDFYTRNGYNGAQACLPKVKLDWSASTSANFDVSDRLRPEGLLLFETFRPFADGNGGLLSTRQERYVGAPMNDSWVNCHIIENGSLSLRQISATKLLATYQGSAVTTNTDSPACMVKFPGARQTLVFYLTK